MRIVVMGGGTGTIPVLCGLKKFTKDLTAIVTMADSGGHSGFLRDELGVLPPGDVRNCIISLADEKKKALLRALLDYQIHYPRNNFKENVGNLILTALADIAGASRRQDRAVSVASRRIIDPLLRWGLCGLVQYARAHCLQK